MTHSAKPDITRDGYWHDCYSCGGEGVRDGDCTCMDDTCCCLEPTPPRCDICKGAGGWVAKEPPDDLP